jgi:tetratricopeptide (TPR) repeat protein
LSGYGNALSLVGRGGEAQKSLDEALGLARENKSEPLMAQIPNYQGDLSFYEGDLKSARSQYEQALRMASHTSDRDKVLISRINLAKVAAKEGRPQEAAGELRALGQKAESLGLKPLLIECSVYEAEAMIDSKNYARARQQLEHDLGNSEKLGLRMHTAKIHYLLGVALRLSGNALEAAPQYATVLRLLGEIQKEPGAEHITDRSDLHAIYTESVRWAQTQKP